jgi:hypothetical protein
MVMYLSQDCIQKWMQRFIHEVWEMDDVLQPGHCALRILWKRRHNLIKLQNGLVS